jgi:ferrous iron transport protein B
MSHESATVIQLPVVNERAKVVALAGIPNSGKTSLFNGLTGARQHVGNYPGVTVERKEGFRRFGDLDLKFVDLPGTYSLTTISAEERVARQVLLDTAEPPDLVVCVVDASNLERHLYLAVQLIEADLPVVIALNMVDVARSHGFRIDSAALSKLLRVPVVETVGRRAEGVVDLLKAIRERLAFTAGGPAFRVDYGLDAEPEIERLQGLMSVVGSDSPGARARAIALLESAPNGLDGVSEGIRDAAFNAAERIETRTGDPVDVIIAERRHGAAVGLGHQVRRKLRAASLDMTRAIDAVLVNRWLGLPIFLAAMYAVFFLTFTVADPLAGWIESGIGWLGDVLGGAWAQGTAPLARSLVIDGIIGGVGGVHRLPAQHRAALSGDRRCSKDSGYMARAAFVMDRFMRKVGLHGKSFIPMLFGFGCSIPAIMATRTIESRRARLIDHAGPAAHELRCATAHLRPDHPVVLRNALAGAGAMGHLRARDPPGHGVGVVVALHHVRRTGTAVRDGVAAVPAPDPQECRHPCLRAGVVVCAQGGHGDPRDFHRDVGPEHLPSLPAREPG